jgi:hypothetical protein
MTLDFRLLIRVVKILSSMRSIYLVNDPRARQADFDDLAAWICPDFVEPFSMLPVPRASSVMPETDTPAALDDLHGSSHAAAWRRTGSDRAQGQSMSAADISLLARLAVDRPI